MANKQKIYYLDTKNININKAKVNQIVNKKN